jgi:Putative beta barrel porin-7 (BBP7)
MRRIWRRCLSLSVGLLVGSGGIAVAAEPPDAEPQIIAQTPLPPARPGPVHGTGSMASASPPPEAAFPTRPQRSMSWATPENRPLAVTLGRPHTLTAPQTEGGVQQVSFRTERRPLFPLTRTTSLERQPMPSGPPQTILPPPRPVETAFPLPPPAGTTLPTNPPPVASTGPVPSPEFATGWGGPEGWVAGESPGEECFACGMEDSRNFASLFYLQSEYLRWKLRGSNFPPLITTGATTAPTFVPGALSGAQSSVLFGGSDVGNNTRSGYRLRAGIWLNRDHDLGFEGSYFTLGDDSQNFLSNPFQQTLLAVPYVNATTGNENALVLTSPGQSLGMVRAELGTRLWGAEANLRRNFVVCPCGFLDVIAGFRTLGLDDRFELSAMSTGTGAGMMPTIYQDRFSTHNRFYGGQLGVQAEWRWRRWTLDTNCKVGVGNTSQSVDIGGNTIMGGAPQTGGIFAQTTNMGHFSRNRFSVVPEWGINLGYQLTGCLRVYAGYNLIYWTNVVRPGEQIDRSINFTQTPAAGTPARPAFVFKESDFWVQGLNLGLEFRY